MRYLAVLLFFHLLLASTAVTGPHSGIRPLHTATGGQQPPLRLVRKIPLPKVQGRIDHLDVDVDNQKLFIAALGNNSLEVVDFRAGKRIRSVSGFHEPQGIRFLPDVKKVVVANGGDGAVSFVDAASFKVTRAIDLDGDADNVRYEAGRKRVYVGYGRGALAVLTLDG